MHLPVLKAGFVIRSVSLVAMAIALLTLAGPADAAFPGQNGKIAITNRGAVFSETYIATLNPDGSGLTRLTSTGKDLLPSWSPDGQKIVFTSTRDGNAEIYTMNADGSGQTRITNDPAGDGESVWSPDGTKIAFVSTRDGNRKIYTMGADGSSQTRITNNPASEAEPVWSPDGTKIAFVSNRHCPPPNEFVLCRSEIYTMSVDGSGVTRVTEAPCFVDGNSGPDWSPDAQKIVFWRSVETSCSTEAEFNGFQLLVINADGTEQKELTSRCCAIDWQPAWSPDGQQIVFKSDRSSSLNAIWAMNADGTGLRLLDNGIDASPDWQPLRGPQRSDYKNAAQFCKAERDFLGDETFTQKYGDGANANGKCVSQTH
jgi:Tol biopolymer transport system component